MVNVAASWSQFHMLTLVKCSPLVKLWNEWLPVRHNFGSSFWMCGVNSFHWHETAIPIGILSRQGGPSIVLPLHYYWLLLCWVLLHGNINGPESWQIFSFTWICHLLYSFPYIFAWRNVQDDPVEITPCFQSLIFLVSEHMVWLLQCIVGSGLGLE